MLSHIITQINNLSTPESMQYMQTYFKMKQPSICFVCEGYGHVSSNCGTKKRLDGITKGTGMKEHWGQIKSISKMEFMHDKADVAQEMRDDLFVRVKQSNELYAQSEETAFREKVSKRRQEQQASMRTET